MRFREVQPGVGEQADQQTGNLPQQDGILFYWGGGENMKALAQMNLLNDNWTKKAEIVYPVGMNFKL